MKQFLFLLLLFTIIHAYYWKVSKYYYIPNCAGNQTALVANYVNSKCNDQCFNKNVNSFNSYSEDCSESNPPFWKLPPGMAGIIQYSGSVCSSSYIYSIQAYVYNFCSVFPSKDWFFTPISCDGRFLKASYCTGYCYPSGTCTNVVLDTTKCQIINGTAMQYICS